MDESGYEVYRLGVAAYERGDHEAALDMFRRSFEIQPHFKSLEKIGECLMRMGSLSEAVADLRRAVSLNPRSSKTAVLLGEALLQGGDAANARLVAMSVLRRKGDYGPALRLLERADGSLNGG